MVRAEEVPFARWKQGAARDVRHRAWIRQHQGGQHGCKNEQGEQEESQPSTTV
jgi:hypothetical protein